MDKFNGNRLWTIYSAGANDTMSISVFNGFASIAVFRKNSQDRKPAAKLSLSNSTAKLMSNVLRKLIEASGTLRLSLSFMERNQETKQDELAATIVFEKDEKRACYLELTTRTITTPIKFALRAPNNVQVGSDPNSDEMRAKLGAESFIDFLEHELPIAKMLSRIGMDTSGGNKGGYQKKGYNNNNSGGYNSNGGGYNNKPQDPYGGKTEEGSFTF